MLSASPPLNDDKKRCGILLGNDIYAYCESYTYVPGYSNFNLFEILMRHKPACTALLLP